MRSPKLIHIETLTDTLDIKIKSIEGQIELHIYKDSVNKTLLYLTRQEAEDIVTSITLFLNS